MDSKQQRFVLIVIAGIFLLWILSPLAAFHPSTPSITTDPLQFDAVRAYGNIEDFVTQCPNRVLGSFESRHATGFLRDILEKLGYELDYMQFSGRIHSSKQVGRNVLGFKPGQDPEIIAIVAHYDAVATTIQGAADNGSGVGVLIEIARIMAERPTRKSILIVFTDGGVWGMLGSKDLATRYDGRNRISAVLSLDHVSIGDLAALRLDATGLMEGFTPPWYRMLALQAAQTAGLPVQSPAALREHFSRTLYIPWSDQGPFLASGTSAINLSSISVDPDLAKAVYHSPQDTIDNLRISSVESFGLAAEKIIRSLDALPSIPSDRQDSFLLGHNLFLGPVAIRLLHIILFIPLPLCIFFHTKNHSHSIRIKGMGREFLACLATLFPLLIFYLLLGLFRILRLLPVYELYPATTKDPVLQNPAWGILAGILVTVVIVAGLCAWLYVFAFRKRPLQNYFTSKTALLYLMLITIVPALLYNSYWAVTFLTLPCWIWCLLPKGSNGKKRLLHWILILTTAIPCCVVLWLFASPLHLGLNFIWYYTLALNAGLFTAPGFILGSAATVLGIRFMIIQLHDDGTDRAGT